MSRYDRERDRKRVLLTVVVVLLVGALFFGFGHISQQAMDTAAHETVLER